MVQSSPDFDDELLALALLFLTAAPYQLKYDES